MSVSTPGDFEGLNGDGTVGGVCTSLNAPKLTTYNAEIVCATAAMSAVGNAGAIFTATVNATMTFSSEL
jgi:hypothetical protein